MITVYVPALNEESHLRLSVVTIIKTAEASGFIPLDIIIVNDGSTDGTQHVIHQLEKEFPFVRSIHHTKNKGIGYGFMGVLQKAKYQKITAFSADVCPPVSLMTRLFQNANKADFVISYPVNTEYRGRLRYFLSHLFSMIYAQTFDLHIKYINGFGIYPRDLLKEVKLKSKRYSIFSEIAVKLLRSGVNFFEIPSEMNPTMIQKSSSLKLRNVLEVIGTYLRLIYEVFIKYRSRFNVSPKRVAVIVD